MEGRFRCHKCGYILDRDVETEAYEYFDYYAKFPIGGGDTLEEDYPLYRMKVICTHCGLINEFVFGVSKMKNDTICLDLLPWNSSLCSLVYLMDLVFELGKHIPGRSGKKRDLHSLFNELITTLAKVDRKA